MLAAGAIMLAWLLDACFGEPSSAWHPVAWFGRLMAPLGRVLPRFGAKAGLIAGAMAWITAVGGVAMAAWALQIWITGLPAWLALPLLALALKPSFAWRMLSDEVQAVDTALLRKLCGV